jgi:hypothetical protein
VWTRLDWSVGGKFPVSRLYPILLSITVALAIGVYLNPGEARKVIQQAQQWGAGVLEETLRGPRTFAVEMEGNPSNQSTYPYPAAGQAPNWGYNVPTQGMPAANSQMATPANTSVYPRVLASGNQSQQKYATTESNPLRQEYPRVQWAGDWQDFEGVPESAKSTQSQHGYLPPPEVDSTMATVDRYLPAGPTYPPQSSQSPSRANAARAQQA